MINAIIPWLAFVLAVIGSVLNSRKNITGFYYLIGSNSLFIYDGIVSHRYAAMCTFTTFLLIRVYGIYEWKRLKVKEKPLGIGT